jgi:hypothetical protein
VAHRPLAVDLVGILPARAVPRQVSALLEIRDDPLHGTFGHPNLFGDVPETQLRRPREAEQHVPVVGEERPS